MKTTFQFIGSLLVAAAVAGLAYTSFLAVQTYQEATRNQAVDDCLKVSSKTWSEVNPADQTLINTTTEPNMYWTTLCLQEKGVTLRTELK